MSHRTSKQKTTKIDRQGFLPCYNEVIMMTNKSPVWDSENDLIIFDETFPDFPPVGGRERLSSYADSSTNSSCTPYSVPSFMNIDFVEEAANTPKKSKEHRRNRHVLASSTKISKQTTPTKKRDSSANRRRRNKAWNAMDFETFMGFDLHSK